MQCFFLFLTDVVQSSCLFTTFPFASQKRNLPGAWVKPESLRPCHIWSKFHECFFRGGSLRLMKFSCMFLFKKTSKNASISKSSIVLVIDQSNLSIIGHWLEQCIQQTSTSAQNCFAPFGRQTQSQNLRRPSHQKTNKQIAQGQKELPGTRKGKGSNWLSALLLGADWSHWEQD